MAASEKLHSLEVCKASGGDGALHPRARLTARIASDLWQRLLQKYESCTSSARVKATSPARCRRISRVLC